MRVVSVRLQLYLQCGLDAYGMVQHGLMVQCDWQALGCDEQDIDSLPEDGCGTFSATVAETTTTHQYHYEFWYKSSH